MRLADIAGLRRSYRAFNAALGSLYESDLLELAGATDKPGFDDTAFFDAAGMVYRAGGFDASQLNTPEARRLIAETLNQLNTAISSGIDHEVPETVRYALENNAFIFSGFKAYHTLREVGLSLTTDKGDIKPFETFRRDVEAVNKQYNHSYLYAEYNHAVGASLMASRWQKIEKDGDRYDLQYRTAGDDRVREDHAILNGTTLPPSDPFWSLYLPPNGWNCRCTAVQVRKGKYEQSDPDLAMQRGNNCTEAAKQQIFRFNPGKTLQLFPPKHPYFKAPAEVKQVVEQLSEEQKREQRIAEMITELPSHLTEAEKKAIATHNLEIEKVLGITKGKPKTVEQADEQSANPNYGKDRSFGINCQTCAPAYALRLLGFDVTAKANTRGSLSEYLSRQHSFEAWSNADGSKPTPSLTYDWMVAKGYKLMNKKRYEEYFNECCNETGVYILTIGWKGGGGHATILQRFEDGTLSYIEPQVYDKKTGARRSIDELCNYGSAKPIRTRGVLRVDNKLFNTKFASIFEVKTNNP
ncbi:MAG: minor capsid protein [Muribaculaceae bacterium]|nr:minor capsid protein [Muribaculaceae bacterium]